MIRLIFKVVRQVCMMSKLGNIEIKTDKRHVDRHHSVNDQQANLLGHIVPSRMASNNLRLV